MAAAHGSRSAAAMLAATRAVETWAAAMRAAPEPAVGPVSEAGPALAGRRRPEALPDAALGVPLVSAGAGLADAFLGERLAPSAGALAGAGVAATLELRPALAVVPVLALRGPLPALVAFAPFAALAGAGTLAAFLALIALVTGATLAVLATLRGLAPGRLDAFGSLAAGGADAVTRLVALDFEGGGTSVASSSSGTASESIAARRRSGST